MLAFRLELARPRKEGHRIAVVDLDEDYLPVGAPLVIEPAMVRCVHHQQEGVSSPDKGRGSMAAGPRNSLGLGMASALNVGRACSFGGASFRRSLVGVAGAVRGQGARHRAGPCGEAMTWDEHLNKAP